MEVGAGGTLVEKVLEVVVVCAVVDGGVHDVREGGVRDRKERGKERVWRKRAEEEGSEEDRGRWPGGTEATLCLWHWRLRLRLNTEHRVLRDS